MEPDRTESRSAVAGGRKAGDRYMAIAALPKQEAGISKHTIRSGLAGRAWLRSGRISAPEGRTPSQLYILAHECAHIALRHLGKPVHVMEMEAELWAHEALRRHGVPVPRAMTERAQRYVAGKIARALKRGARHIEPKAIHFAKIDSGSIHFAGAEKPKKSPEAVDRWCREHGKTERALGRLLERWSGRFVRLEEGDGGLSQWIALCMACSIKDAVSVLRWARLYPTKSTPPTPYFPEL